MYRIGAFVVRNTALLTRRINPVEFRIASLSRSPASPAWYKKIREREPCPPPPPPPLKPFKVNFYLISTGLLLALTAGFIVVAKGNPEVRDWLSIHMPWFDDLIAALYEENVPIKESIDEYIQYFKDVLDSYMKELPEECYKPPPPAHQPPPVNVANKAPIDDETCDDDDDDDDTDEDDDKEEDDDSDKTCTIPVPPVRTKDICQFEECLQETAEEVVNNYMTARDYCIYYNKLVKGTMFNFSMKGLKYLKSQMEERDETIEQFVNVNNEDAEKRFGDMVGHMKCGIDAPEERIDVTRKKAKEYQDVITRNKAEFQMAYAESLQRDKQWKMVECLIDVYVLEVGALYPEYDAFAEHPYIEGDFDFLLIHTKKYVDKLKAGLDNAVFSTSSKISRAYDALPIEKGKEKEAEAKLEEAVKKAKADMDKEFSDRMEQMKKDSDDELKVKLDVQQKVIDERAEKKLEAKEKELTESAEKMVAEKLAAEKKILDAELATMEFQVRILEEKLEEKMKAEKETRRAAMLYAASASLLAATAKGDPRVKVDKELEILRNNSLNDTLVSTVLNAIPVEVKDKGLVPECVIRDRFYTMEDIALKVAMVEAHGGPLPMYAISWLQSKFLFMKPATIPQVELDNPPKEPFEDFDTFDLLQRARYFMSKGNLASAVRYVDALEGASRGAAESWYQSANALLQTRQAAQAILAHAAAISLKYL